MSPLLHLGGQLYVGHPITETIGRGSAVTSTAISEPLHSKVERSRESKEEDACERWLGPDTSTKEAFPWNHKKARKHRLIHFDNHKDCSPTPEDKDNQDPWLQRMQYMMFSQGDSSEPLLECKMFMLETVWQEMNLLLRRCWQRAQLEERTFIALEDVVFQMRNNVHRLYRLVENNIRGQKYSENNVYTTSTISKMLTTNQCKDATEPPTNVMHTAEADVFESRAHCTTLTFSSNSSNQNVNNARRDCLLLFDDSFVRYNDPVMHNRKRRLRVREKFLDDRDREDLKTAKTVGFTSRCGRRSAFYAERFDAFLGRPPIETDLIYTLDFLAQEIVADIVDDASRLRDVELEADQFDDVWHEGEDVIQIRHYERAYQQHPGVVRNNDLLFGVEEQNYTRREHRVKRRIIQLAETFRKSNEMRMRKQRAAEVERRLAARAANRERRMCLEWQRGKDGDVDNKKYKAQRTPVV